MRVLATFILLCAFADPARAETTHDAKALIGAYNARPIGSVGWRRVTLELSTKDVVTRTLTVSNVWAATKDGVRTLFALEAPDGMRGICYLLAESPAARRFMQVHLFMPVGAKKLLEVSSALEEQGLLGSDFTYRDVTWRLPETGFDARITGEGELANEPVTFIELVATKPGDTWPRRRFAIARSLPLILAIDFYRPGSSIPDKTYRVDRFELRDKVWTPTRITIRRGGAMSVLSLEAAGFGLASIPDSLLAPEHLGETAERIRSGTTIEQVLGLASPAKNSR